MLTDELEKQFFDVLDEAKKRLETSTKLGNNKTVVTQSLDYWIYVVAYEQGHSHGWSQCRDDYEDYLDKLLEEKDQDN